MPPDARKVDIVKVVAFDGSKEPRGPVGRLVVELVERLESSGVEAEIVRLERIRETGCFMCGQCGHRTAPIGCDRPAEDGLRRAVRKLKAADAIVVATPAYGTGSSPATQRVLLRLEYDRREKGDARLAGKPALIVTGPLGSGLEAVADGLRLRLQAQGASVLGVLGADAPYDDVDAAVEGLVAAFAAAIR